MNNTYTDDMNEQVVFLDYHIDIPDYVRRFDALLSFLNIKTEDVSMLFAVGKPASKAVTLERYKMFLKLDFKTLFILHTLSLFVLLYLCGVMFGTMQT